MFKRIYTCLGGLLSLCLAITPCGTAADTLLGIYCGNQGWNMEQVRALESWQGKRHAVVNLFTNWSSTTKDIDNLFKQQLPNIWNNGNVPMITWEPFTGGKTPADIVVRIANGEYDAYINTWATRLKTFLSGPDGSNGTVDDRRVYIRLAHEMNGNWYPWGAATGGNTPADYVAMWQRVIGIFDYKLLDATRLQWVWCVNSEDVGGYTAEQFYPGDGYVDWIAIDGYNWGTSQTWSTWRSPESIYTDMLGRVRKLSSKLSNIPKPVAITEFASTSSTSSGTSVNDKLRWISDFFSYATGNDIRMVNWFNEDKETDWAIFGGSNGNGAFKYGRTTYKTYSFYKADSSGFGVTAPNIISSDKTNPRLLTDGQFAGQ